MSGRSTRCRGERGQVAGIEAVPFGVLVFVSGSLLLVNIWGVVDTKFAADAAAREATRYLAESAAAEVDAGRVRDHARALAVTTMEAHGRPGPVDVEVDPAIGDIRRCARVRVTVRSTVPAIRIPFVGGHGRAFDVAASHTELVDPTRSGVAGEADCIR